DDIAAAAAGGEQSGRVRHIAERESVDRFGAALKVKQFDPRDVCAVGREGDLDDGIEAHDVLGVGKDAALAVDDFQTGVGVAVIAGSGPALAVEAMGDDGGRHTLPRPPFEPEAIDIEYAFDPGVDDDGERDRFR